MSTVTDNSFDEASSGLTVGQFCEYVAPSVWSDLAILKWPPDVFALAAALLLKSGAYVHAVSGWQRHGKLRQWTKLVREIGWAWHTNPEEPPEQVRKWYESVRDKAPAFVEDICAHDICGDDDLCCMLIQLCSAADEACVGVGCTLPNRDDVDPFLEEASEMLFNTAAFYGVSTLCKQIRHSTVRVLPKLHTPQSGITIRSLTHNLALCPAGDVKVKWAESLSQPRHCLNLLLAPWPLQVAPAHFRPVKSVDAVLPDLAKDYGFFEYSPPDNYSPPPPLKQFFGVKSNTEPFTWLDALLKNARNVVSKIDGVIFPESALTLREYDEISERLMDDGIFLICGVREGPPAGRKGAQNYVRFDIPGTPGPSSYRQFKHHRWRVDPRQITQYGLGSALDIALNWWEHTTIGNRELHFVVLDNWLTVCPLICEDLARQDPIAELVRAVGPNLVIALLMDGPQLPSRWPARYATVLADDPGSSVLTLTSLGMAELSRPPAAATPSRAIALWKDAKTGEAVSIELPRDKQAAVLSLSRVFVNEYAADGRDDGGMTGYPTLTGIHYLSSG
jgi:hypothetical protein